MTMRKNKREKTTIDSHRKGNLAAKYFHLLQFLFIRHQHVIAKQLGEGKTTNV